MSRVEACRQAVVVVVYGCCSVLGAVEKVPSILSAIYPSAIYPRVMILDVVLLGAQVKEGSRPGGVPFRGGTQGIPTCAATCDV